MVSEKRKVSCGTYPTDLFNILRGIWWISIPSKKREPLEDSKIRTSRLHKTVFPDPVLPTITIFSPPWMVRSILSRRGSPPFPVEKVNPFISILPLNGPGSTASGESEISGTLSKFLFHRTKRALPPLNHLVPPPNAIIGQASIPK